MGRQASEELVNEAMDIIASTILELKAWISIRSSRSLVQYAPDEGIIAQFCFAESLNECCHVKSILSYLIQVDDRMGACVTKGGMGLHKKR
jgi:hypothetical protein